METHRSKGWFQCFKLLSLQRLSMEHPGWHPDAYFGNGYEFQTYEKPSLTKKKSYIPIVPCISYFCTNGHFAHVSIQKSEACTVGNRYSAGPTKSDLRIRGFAGPTKSDPRIRGTWAFE